MKYKSLSSSRYHFKEYSITTIRKKDLVLIKKWRNEQIDFLRQKTILTDADQKKYYSQIIRPSLDANKPHVIIFSFLRNRKCIGYGGLTNIDWISKKAEISFLVDTKRYLKNRVYRSDFNAFLYMISNISFRELDMNRVFTETYDVRPVHIDVLEKHGFRLEGRLKQHVFKRGQFLDSLIHGLLKRHYVEKRTVVK